MFPIKYPLVTFRLTLSRWILWGFTIFSLVFMVTAYCAEDCSSINFLLYEVNEQLYSFELSLKKTIRAVTKFWYAQDFDRLENLDISKVDDKLEAISKLQDEIDHYFLMYERILQDFEEQIFFLEKQIQDSSLSDVDREDLLQKLSNLKSFFHKVSSNVFFYKNSFFEEIPLVIQELDQLKNKKD